MGSMRTNRKTTGIAALLSLVTLVLTGCIPTDGKNERTPAQLGLGSGGAPTTSGGAGNGSIVPSGLGEVAAFQQTLHPQIQSRSCRTCHSQATLAIAPFFAETDAAAAWNALKNAGKVNLLSPASSAIVAKMQLNHNCGGASDCAAAASAFTTAINNMNILMQAPPTNNTGGGNTGGGTTTVPGLSSVEAFRQSLWPVLRTAPATCTNCHGDNGPRAPYAASNLQTAHDALVGGGLVILNDPSRAGQSAIVLKIRGGHEGHPVALADTMQAAIVTWRALMQPTQQTTGGGSFGNREVSAQINLPMLPANMIYAEAEAATLTQFAVTANSTASGLSGITTPGNNGTNFADPNASPRIARFTVNVTQAGTYRIWGRTFAGTANDNSFHVRVDNGAFAVWQLPVDANGLVWNLVNNNNLNTPRTFNLAAGTHTIEIRQNEDGAFLDKILLTSDNGVTPFGWGSRTLEWNVGQLAGFNDVLFRVDMADFDQYSYAFTNPRLVVPAGGSIVVRDVMIHLNNVYNAGDATFTVIDDEVAAPGGALNNDGLLPAGLSLIVVKGTNPAMDTFKVSFGSIQAR